MNSFVKRSFLILTALLVAAAPACGGDSGGSGDGGGTPDGGAGGASVSASTQATTVDCASLVTLDVTVTGFTLEEPNGQSNQDGHGHYHVYLDGATGADYLAVGGSATVDVQLPATLAAGDHTLTVQLMNNDHTPVSPPVTSDVTITVTSNPCLAVTIDPDSVAAGEAVTFTITVGNFILEDPVGQPNAPGHGHYHIYLDAATGGAYLAAGAVTPIDITVPAGTASGPHTFHVDLTQNNHAPLSPPVDVFIPFAVQ